MRRPLVINHARSRRFTELANLFQDRHQATFAAGPEAGFVRLDGEVHDGDSGVLLHGEKPQIGVQHLDPEDPRQGANGGLSEMSKILILRALTRVIALL